MRLAFHNGEVHSPQMYMPNLYHRPGVRGLGVDYAQEFADATQGMTFDQGPSMTDVLGGSFAGAVQGASYATAIGGGKTGPVIGAAIAGTSLAATIMAFSAAAGPFAPFVAMAGSLIGPIASMFKGCGTTCTQATKIANDCQVAADQIIARYRAEPIHYYSVQQAALAAMDDIMRYLRGACGSATLGAAGQRCISERLDPNACVIKDDQGGCHNFWIDYVNPIANDTTVVPDPIDTSSASGMLQGLFSNIPMPVILGVAGVGLYFLMSGDGK